MSVLDDPIDPSPGWQLSHLRRYVETGGSDGHLWRGAPTLLLTVRDPKLNRGRRTPLIYGEDDGRYVVVASAGGRPTHPLWYRCLVADPHVRLQVMDKIFDAHAETASGAERERLSRVMKKIWPPYDEYQAKTDRQIPVVTLRPI